MKIGVDALYLQMPNYRAGLYSYTLNILKSLFDIDKHNTYDLHLSSSKTLDTGFAKDLVDNIGNASIVIDKIPQRLFPFIDKLPILNSKLIRPHDVYYGPTYRLFPRGVYTKSVVTIHDLRFILQPDTLHDKKAVFEFTKMTMNALEKADKIIAISAYTKNQLIDNIGVDANKVELVQNGVGNEYYVRVGDNVIQKILTKYNIKKPYVYFLGHIEEKKNIIRLIHAYDEIRKQSKVPLNLVLAGPPSDYSAKVKDEIHALNIEEYISLIGGVDSEDLPGLYQGAELFAFPSLNEGFGLPPVEAMASGVPVLASNAGALPEVLGDAATLVDPYDTQAIAEGINTIINNPDMKSTLAKRGVERAKCYSWTESARKTLNIFKKIQD